MIQCMKSIHVESRIPHKTIGTFLTMLYLYHPSAQAAQRIIKYCLKCSNPFIFFSHFNATTHKNVEFYSLEHSANNSSGYD